MLHPYLRRRGCCKRSRFSVTRVHREREIVNQNGIDENEKPLEKKPFTFIIIGSAVSTHTIAQDWITQIFSETV